MSIQKIIAILILLILIIGIPLIILTPPKAHYEDTVFEAIGGDEFLNVTLKHCLKIDEKNIPDASFQTSAGEIKYFDAKNITYVDTFGNKDYFIVWKTTPDKYNWVKNNDINQYISTYLRGDVKGKCFVEYSYEDKYVYGVMVSTVTHDYSESELIYDILGLNRSGFDLTYSSTPPSYSTYSPSQSGGYHTVVPDRYTLSRTDPGAYYDHYEYGDNYDIDDYLESEGYD